MSQQAPSQLFDGSYFEAQENAPALKTAAPPGEKERFQIDFDVASTPEEFDEFDWDAFNREIADLFPRSEDGDLVKDRLREIAGAQLWMCHRLPVETLRYLLTDQTVKSLWGYLGQERFKELKRNALRGFQQTPGSLKREPVIKRLVEWLKLHPFEIHLLLIFWGARVPPATVLEAVESQPDEATLKGRIPSLLRSFGLGATVAALVYSGQPRVFKAAADLVMQSENFGEMVKNAPPFDAQEVPPAPSAPPEPDSPAAHFWHEKTMEARNLIEGADLIIQDNQTVRDQLEKSNARLKTLECDLAAAKKREKQSAIKTAQKLEQVEHKGADKYAELEKNYARQERRLRASLGGYEELEAENKRQKKQLRQSAQSREDERRKVVALEAQLAQLTPAPSASTRPAMDAVSSPPTTQDAPNRPVKVSRPGPFDEIFEWQADGRRVRLTAREVRRLIDKNDEDRVADIMLALEALQGSNPDLRRRFLTRLGQAGAHYPRVLTHRTSRVLVDASNVARFCPNRYGKGHLSHLISMRAELQRLDCWPIVFVADASLPHFIDKPHELREMARQGEIQITDKGIEADEILAREARKTGAYVVTNDAKFFHKVSPDFEPPRISFRVHDDLVIVDEF